MEEGFGQGAEEKAWYELIARFGESPCLPPFLSLLHGLGKEKEKKRMVPWTLKLLSLCLSSPASARLRASDVVVGLLCVGFSLAGRGSVSSTLSALLVASSWGRPLPSDTGIFTTGLSF